MTTPTVLDQLAAYVPAPVVQEIYKQPRLPTEPFARRLPAAVLLTDISGFTPLTELLAQEGPTGAGELTRFVNRVSSQ